MKFLKQNFKIIFCFAVGILLISSITVYAYFCAANEVQYTDNKTVGDALNDLYSKFTSTAGKIKYDISVTNMSNDSFDINVVTDIPNTSEVLEYYVNGTKVYEGTEKSYRVSGLSENTQYTVMVLGKGKNNLVVTTGAGNDINTWLACIGNSNNEHYTLDNISELFEDESLVAELFNNETAIAYMSSSPEIIDSIVSNNSVLDKLKTSNISISVPTMGADSSRVTSGQIYGSGYEAWRVFDGLNGEGHKWAGVGSTYDANRYIQYQFDTPNRIYEIDITNHTYSTNECPTAFELLGSNDGINWEQILPKTTIANIDLGITNKFFVTDYIKKYSYYRICGLSCTSGNTCIGELQFHCIK